MNMFENLCDVVRDDMGLRLLLNDEVAEVELEDSGRFYVTSMVTELGFYADEVEVDEVGEFGLAFSVQGVSFECQLVKVLTIS